MKPLVSILIPAYNAECWIADTIKSAIGQTWPNKEIIVVDDGSCDQTLPAARKFASRNVLVITQQNQGAAAARNKAFQLCNGDYIQWLDADDLLAPNKIDKQMDVARGQSRRMLISSSWGYFMYRTSKARFVSSPLWSDQAPLEWLVRKWEHNAHMQTATWLVSRELAEMAGPFDTRLLGDDDGEYFFRVIMNSDGIRFVPEARVFYRAAGSNRLSYIGLSERKMEAQFLGMKMQIGYLRKMEDSKRVRAACVNYLQTWLGYFYPNRPDIVEQTRLMVADLGGKLEVPHLRWKYGWMRPIFGYSLAKRAEFLLPQVRWSVASLWDKAMFLLQHENDRLVS